jgi:hypothetical protein
MVDNDVPIWDDLDLAAHTTKVNQEMEINEIKLPLLFNAKHPTFASQQHLYSIYLDSYRCILYGLYHPGIMVLTQLIEATVNEIIYVHDGVPNHNTLKGTIEYCENANGRKRRCSRLPNASAPLFPKFVIDYLKSLLVVRDSYIHLNYTKLFKDQSVGILGFDAPETVEEGIQRLKTAHTKLMTGKITYTPVKIDFDTRFADQTKRNVDPEWAREWAWEIYSGFWFLVDEYLTSEDYETHIRLYGSPFDKIPVTNIDD